MLLIVTRVCNSDVNLVGNIRYSCHSLSALSICSGSRPKVAEVGDFTKYVYRIMMRRGLNFIVYWAWRATVGVIWRYAIGGQCKNSTISSSINPYTPQKMLMLTGLGWFELWRWHLQFDSGIDHWLLMKPASAWAPLEFWSLATLLTVINNLTCSSYVNRREENASRQDIKSSDC